MKLDGAAAQIQRDMDLGRFIRRQRQLSIAVLSLLSGMQTHLVTKMSALTIQDREGRSKFSDNDQGSSSEDQGDQKKRECIAERFATKISQSANEVDQKLLKLLDIRQNTLTFKPKTSTGSSNLLAFKPKTSTGSRLKKKTSKIVNYPVTTQDITIHDE